MNTPHPFQIHVEQEQLDDLHRRLERTRWPFADNTWDLGTPASYVRDVVEYWRTQYDWRRKERKLNEFPQYTCRLGGQTVHFFHIRSSQKDAVPLLLTHGWPDSFLRYAKIFSLLPEYDLIVPSLPGFAFSTLPAQGFTNNAQVAERWHTLMRDVLGYQSYIASGGDMGRGVTCYLAARYPQEVKGIHLTDVGLVRELLEAPDHMLSPEELDYKQKARKWLSQEGAYINIQSTKPQSLAYGLSDSPVGMAAWLLEKYHAWSDEALLTKDDLCDALTLYWVTNTAATSIRMYHGNSFTLPPMDKITVPTAVAAFARDVLSAPRAWIEKNYPVVQYTQIPRGGHFTALEQPEAFARSLREFIQKLGSIPH